MSVCARVLVIAVVAFVNMAAHAQLPGSTSVPVPRWPHGARVAVSLAYDDALNSQLDIAVPALNRHGLKASFYLTLSSETVQTRMADWRNVAAKGHELGNHTLFHQCSRSATDRSWVTPDNDLDTTTVGRLVAQIRVGNILLHAIDGKTLRTYTAPCGDLMASGIPYLEAIQGDFVAMKTKFGGVVPEMRTLDPYSVGIEAPADVSGPQLIALVQRAATAGTMVNITFHGVGGDYLAVSREAHEELLNYLSTHRDIYWTDTFINIMQYVKAQRSKAQSPSLPSSPQKLQ
jgi:peptidoglycan/xylan/chitin deacetylase (PgdA/CDA1 family)